MSSERTSCRKAHQRRGFRGCSRGSKRLEVRRGTGGEGRSRVRSACAKKGLACRETWREERRGKERGEGGCGVGGGRGGRRWQQILHPDVNSIAGTQFARLRHSEKQKRRAATAATATSTTTIILTGQLHAGRLGT